MCTNFEKRIYNEFLKNQRGQKNQPFRPRKKFDNINDTVKLCLQKLSSFFINNPDVDVQKFFEAPYKIYPSGEDFPLKFYATSKAIGVYKIFINSKKTVDDGKKSDTMVSVSEKLN
jgi:hypothetical protein